jgi:hypothetical protein
MEEGLSHINPSCCLDSKVGQLVSGFNRRHLLDRLTYMKDSFWLRMSIETKWQRCDSENGNDESIDGQFPIGEVREHK